MLYKFNETKLDWQKVNFMPIFTGLIVIATILSVFFYSLGKSSVQAQIKDDFPNYETYGEVKYIRVFECLNEPFSEKALVQMLEDLNVKYPHVVLAQAILETGHFKSEIFKQNNNLFGMKEAKVRQHTADGTNLGHACYDSWQESVIDYALYQARYLSHIKSESEYLLYLNERYAESGNYDVTVLGLVDRLSLRELFV